MTNRRKVPLREMTGILNNTVEEIEAIAERIRNIRTMKGLRQIDLVSICELDYRHYQDIEGGKCNFSIVTLIKISQGLGVKLSELVS